jgi:hypothetical protein
MSFSYRRILARLAVIGVLLIPALSVSACGAGTHYLANVAAHHVANRLATTPKARRRVNRAFCLYSVYRAAHDFTHHHLIFGALNAHQAILNCEAGFSRNAR